MYKNGYNNDRFLDGKFLICLVMAVVLLAMDHSGHYTSRIRSYASLLISPVYYLVNWPNSFVASTSDYIHSQEKLIGQNNYLKKQNLELQGRLLQFDSVKQENQRLRELLKSSEKVSDKLLVAEVLSFSPEPGIQQCILNQGSNRSVFVGQAVIDAHGIVGQVMEVNALTSRVLLITDLDHATPVEILRNNMRAIAVGMGEKQLVELMNISNTADIIIGDIVISSGLGGRFPSGYPVGKVISVDKNPSLPFAKIIIEPLAQINQIKEALLIWPGSKLTVNDQNDVKNPLLNLSNDQITPNIPNITNAPSTPSGESTPMASTASTANTLSTPGTVNTAGTASSAKDTTESDNANKVAKTEN